MPFTNMSGDPAQEYFSDGLTDDLITALSRLSQLFVIARHSVFTYKGKAVKVQEVSKELGVRYVLEGSVRKTDEQVRINAQLVDATTGHHVWAQRYDRPLQNIFTLQDEIVQKIVTTLGLQLTLQEQGYVTRKHTDNLEAYDVFLRGQEYFWRFTKEANAQARQLWEKAVALDPQYAEAYMWLGTTSYMEWIWRWSLDLQNLERVVEQAQRAVALNDSLPAAHSLLSWGYVQKQQYDQALAEGERAIALDPNETWEASSYVGLANVLSRVGRSEEALRMIELALRRKHAPVDSHLDLVGDAYYLAGRPEEASALLKKFLSRYPNVLPAHLTLAAVYSELGKEAEARDQAAEVLRLNPQFSLEVHKERVPIKDPTMLERHIAALRKAGLK
jgi:adenylate cyclase